MLAPNAELRFRLRRVSCEKKFGNGFRGILFMAVNGGGTLWATRRIAMMGWQFSSLPRSPWQRWSSNANCFLMMII